MAQVTFIKDKCKGCALCVSVCPKQIIKVNEHGLNEKGYHRDEIKTDMEKCNRLRVLCKQFVPTV